MTAALWVFVDDDETAPPAGEELTPVTEEARPTATSPICVSAGNHSGGVYGGVQITWKAPVADTDTITHYRVLQWRPSSGDGRIVGTVDADTYTLRDWRPLSSGTEYWYYVYAVRSDRMAVVSDVSERVSVVRR